jgi:hypothetical protein
MKGSAVAHTQQNGLTAAVLGGGGTEVNGHHRSPHQQLPPHGSGAQHSATSTSVAGHAHSVAAAGGQPRNEATDKSGGNGTTSVGGGVGLSAAGGPCYEKPPGVQHTLQVPPTAAPRRSVGQSGPPTAAQRGAAGAASRRTRFALQVYFHIYL